MPKMRRKSRRSKICGKSRSEGRDMRRDRGSKSGRRYKVNLKRTKGRGRGRGRKSRCRWQIYRIPNKARRRASKRTKGRGRSGRSRDRSRG